MSKRILIVLIAAFFLIGCAGYTVSVKQDAMAEKMECLCAANLGYYVGAKTEFAPVAVEYAMAIREVIKTGDPNLVVKALIDKGLIELARRTNNDPLIAMNVAEVVSIFEFKPVDGQAWTDADKLALYGKLIDRFLYGIEFGKLARNAPK